MGDLSDLVTSTQGGDRDARTSFRVRGTSSAGWVGLHRRGGILVVAVPVLVPVDAVDLLHLLGVGPPAGRGGERVSARRSDEEDATRAPRWKSTGMSWPPTVPPPPDPDGDPDRSPTSGLEAQGEDPFHDVLVQLVRGLVAAVVLLVGVAAFVAWIGR